MPLTRSMRFMFLALLVAMGAAYGVLHAKNDALASQASARTVTP